MAKIFEMPPHLADLIAAGEVVERPASVVKELVENSVDAGAKSVTVEIKNGGMSEIRVTDDGCGIAPEDVETAFLRHATSKLRSERELEAIGTLGFRGEALAAIASVSRVELLTCQRGDGEGTRLLLEAGVKKERSPRGLPAGTTIFVRDLFFNTPARQKFMKNDRAEGSAVSSAVVRLALSHPEVSIRYIREGREEYHTPGDGRLQSAAYCTLGREFARGLLEASNKTDAITVSGYVSTPGACRGNRAWQFFFVNGRAIKSKLLQAAVEQAYKNSLFTGRFPVCLIDMRMALSAVDVNVHPTKMEVRFADERQAFDAVYWAVRGALERQDSTGELKISPGTLKAAGVTADGAGSTAGPREGFFKTVPAGAVKDLQPPKKPRYPAPSYSGAPQRPAMPAGEIVFRDILKPGQTSIELPVSRPAPEERQERPKMPSGEGGWRMVGEALNTYIIVERGDSIFLIDKHAAHERILFDKLRRDEYKPASQLLLAPAIAPLDGGTAQTLLENSEFLGKMGFEIDDFGSGSVAIRQVPIDMDLSDPVGTLEEIAGKLKLGGTRDVESMRDEVLHTVACKAAIKAGRVSDPQELSGLIDKVMSGQVRYCPHGRPVSMELTKNQLDRSFKRA